MSRPRLLDLFCGAGGASVGYHHAGFDVVGVDIEQQPKYPFESIQADALKLLRTGLKTGMICGVWRLADFDAIHASPPCQPHSSLTGWGGTRRVAPGRVDLIPETRTLLTCAGLPYVIENVEGAGLHNAARICGQGLGLRVRRHRRFESNVPLMSVGCHHHEPPVIVVRGSIGRKVFDPRRKAIAPSLALAREVMEMPWASASELADAIPPRYTEHIGSYLLAEVESRAASSDTQEKTA
ncbi:MAG: DNA cytosine methyltransferase [Solirubrobacteraceae bacterium]